jgi:tRNA(fMet)-specific endonuclease VapC
MKYLLDTNAISEAINKQPNPQMMSWLRSMDVQDLYLSVITVGEIKKGIEKLPESQRKDNIKKWFEGELLIEFERRILELDLSVLLQWGELVGDLEKKGRKLPAMDSLIAATVKYYGYTLVTRNEKDFEGVDILVFNPCKSNL